MFTPTEMYDLLFTFFFFLIWLQMCLYMEEQQAKQRFLQPFSVFSEAQAGF